MNHAAQESLTQFGQAAERLGEVLLRDASKDDALLDATIQRFEFTFELAWKTLQKILREEATKDVRYAREAFQEAYAIGWIDNEQLWLTMLTDRNLTSHTYKEAIAKEIYGRIKDYYPPLKALHVHLAEKFRD